MTGERVIGFVSPSNENLYPNIPNFMNNIYATLDGGKSSDKKPYNLQEYENIDEEKKRDYKNLLDSFLYFIKNKNINNYRKSPLTRQETLDKVINNFNNFTNDKEFIDCLIEMDKDSYQELEKEINIPQKIKTLREKYEILKRHINTIKQYNVFKNNNKLNNKEINKYKEYIKNNANDDILRYIITYQTDNYLFNNMKDDFPLIQNFKQSRESYNKDIIQHIEHYDISLIQDAICDLLFQDNAKNIELMVYEMLDRAKYVPDFLQETDKHLLDLLNNLFSLKENIEGTSKDKIGKSIKELIDNDTVLKIKRSSLKIRLLELNNKAKSDFGNDLNNGLTKIDFNKETYKELSTTNGEKVKFYELKDLNALLVRSMQFNERYDQKGMLTKEEYEEFFKRKDRNGFSYSLIDSNSSIENQYVKIDHNRVLFGFLGTGTNKILCANTFDGQTGQANGLKVYKQQYFPIKNFIEQTDPQDHNEIYIENKEVKYPDYIISWDNPPQQDKIDLAYNFRIPIIYLIKDKEKKDSTQSYNTGPNAGYYDYRSFNSGQCYINPKCKPIKSISKFLEQF